jgi:hypothetical protein
MRGFSVHLILSNPLKYSSLKIFYHNGEFLIKPKILVWREFVGYPEIILSKPEVGVNKTLTD